MTFEILLKCLGIIAGCTVRFSIGPIAGYVLQLSFLQTIISTITGMMITVVTLSYGGKKAKDFLSQYSKKPHCPLNKRTRQKVRFWRKYGVWGVAFLTPVLFSPIGGTLVAVSFNEKPQRIIIPMLIAASFWAIIFTFLTFSFGETIFEIFPTLKSKVF